MQINRRAICQLAALSAITPVAWANSGVYPNKPLKTIVPFPPGGGGDTLSRLVLNKVSEELK